MAGTCGKISSSFPVRAVFRPDETGRIYYSKLLAASMASKCVTITVDDSFKNSEGYCYIRTLKVSRQ